MDTDESSADTGPSSVLSGVGEFNVIARIRKIAAESSAPSAQNVVRGIGDDCAVVAAGGKLLLTTDLLVQDVHFKLDKTTPELLGRKAAAVNISDIAAMAGEPAFLLWALAAPPDHPLVELDQMTRGLVERAEQSGAVVVGGDVVRSDKLVISVTVAGRADPPAPVYRSGARPGDHVYVSGTVGDSALGLTRLLELDQPVTRELIRSDPLAGPIMAHLDPPDRTGLAKLLAPVASSMIDLSDGIMSDLVHILEESKLPGATVRADRLPLSESFRAHFKVGRCPAGRALAAAAAGGEDYELLFTARPADEERVLEIASRCGTAVTRIGSITGEQGLVFNDGEDLIPAPRPLFEHFSAEGPGEE